MRVTPRVRITRGPVTTLASLEVQGSAPGLDLEPLQDALEERVNQPFSPQRLEALARRVVELHRAEGYLAADARIAHTELPDHQRAAAIVVDPGPQILLRSVVTRGARITKPVFVQNVVDLDLGSPVTSGDLEALKAQLYDLGVFQRVDLALLGQTNARDLLVTLSERKRTSLEFAPGISTDQGLRTYGRLVRRNLFGLAHQFELLAQLGFEFRSNDVRDWLFDFQNPEGRAAIVYSAPRFPGRRQALVLDSVLRERRQERTWQMDRSGGGAAIEHHVRRSKRRGEGMRDLRLRLGARLDTRRLTQLEGGALLAGEPWAKKLGLNNPDLERRYWRVQESLTGLWVYDLRDEPVRATRGALLSTQIGYTPGLPWDEIRDQSRTAFLKAEARISKYLPLGGLTLHIATSAGYIESFSGVPPLEDRFRLGGTGSLRGFVRDAVGPHRIAPALGVDWPSGIGPVTNYLLHDDPPPGRPPAATRAHRSSPSS